MRQRNLCFRGLSFQLSRAKERTKRNVGEIENGGNEK